MQIGSLLLLLFLLFFFLFLFRPGLAELHAQRYRSSLPRCTLNVQGPAHRFCAAPHIAKAMMSRFSRPGFGRVESHSVILHH